MDITTMVVVWLLVHSAVLVLIVLAGVYLFKTSDNTRLEAMRLRARLNAITDKGNPIRRPYTIPTYRKPEMDLEQLEVIDDEST